MTFIKKYKMFIFISVLVFFIAHQVFAVSWKSYVIHECREYDDCSGTDLNCKTYKLNQALQNSDWSGTRLVNSEAFRTDWLEASYDSMWNDDWYPYGADASRVAIFAGHGASNGKALYFSHPQDNSCWANFANDVRLGTLYGDENALLILFSCCNGLYGVKEWNYRYSKISQILGFHSTAQIDEYQPRDFFNCTGYAPNKNCWWALYTVTGGGYQSPSVMSKGKDLQDAYNHHTYMAMKQGANMGKADESFGWYYWDFIDFGTTCG